MPFLSMIVMIKGIYLITGLLNYSSVEARLFRRVLIALRSLWLTLLLSAASLCSSELRVGWSAWPRDGGALGAAGTCTLGVAQPLDYFTKAGVWLIKVDFCRITNADGLSGLKLPGFGDAAFHLFPFVSLCAVAATQHL